MWKKIWANKVVRWICVLPGALLAALLAQGLAKLFNYWQLGDGLFARFFIECISGSALGGAFVYAGAYIAPTHKRQTAIVMISIVAAFFGMGLFAAFLQGGRVWAYVYGLAMMIAAGVATYQVFILDEFKDRQEL